MYVLLEYFNRTLYINVCDSVIQTIHLSGTLLLLPETHWNLDNSTVCGKSLLANLVTFHTNLCKDYFQCH